MANMRMSNGSGGAKDNPFDNWPDLSDGTALTPYSNRVILDSNSINKYKKIGTDVYVHFKGTLNFTISSTTYNGGMLFSESFPINNPVGKRVDFMYNYIERPVSDKMLIGFYVGETKNLYHVAYGANTYSGEVEFRMIYHDA